MSDPLDLRYLSLGKSLSCAQVPCRGSAPSLKIMATSVGVFLATRLMARMAFSLLDVGDIVVRGSDNATTLTYHDKNTDADVVIDPADDRAAGKCGTWICIQKCGPVENPTTHIWTETPAPVEPPDEYWEEYAAFPHDQLVMQVTGKSLIRLDAGAFTYADEIKLRQWQICINGQRATLIVPSSDIIPEES